MVHHIVLAYSGGLDTSVGIHWLAKKHQAKVTAVLIDLGQPIDSIGAAKERAMRNGAQACIVLDAKHTFATEYLAPAIQANALYEGAYPLATALGRPLIAAQLVRVAQQVGADAIAHGCTGKGNDQVRIEAGIRALAPHLVCLAPQRTHPMSRDEVLRYAALHDLALPPTHEGTYSVDENLWGRSCEGDDLEDPANPVPERAFTWTRAHPESPATPTTVALRFAAGVPVALDGVEMPLHALVAKLNVLAGAQGIGRIDHVENRLIGIKTREVYEAPAAVAVLTAKAALESIVLTRDEDRLARQLQTTFSDLVYDGKWFHPVREAVLAAVQTMQRHVNGTITLALHNGHATVLSRAADHSLFDDGLATYSDADTFHHQAAGGFIELWSLPQVVAGKARGMPPVLEPVP